LSKTNNQSEIFCDFQVQISLCFIDLQKLESHFDVHRFVWQGYTWVGVPSSVGVYPSTHVHQNASVFKKTGF